MHRLTRPRFLALTGLEGAQLHTLDRRGQLPFAIDQAQGRGYELGEAFLTLVTQALGEGQTLALARAAIIVAELPEVLSASWPAIVETGRALAAGTETPPVEILAGRAEAAYPTPPLAVCGTYDDIGADLASAGFQPRALVLVSASSVMALMIARADTLGIDLPADFWSGPLKYRPRPTPLTPEELAEALKEKKQ